MIVINTERVWCIYYRMNKATPWKYADFGGRYESKEEAQQIAEQFKASQKCYDYKIVKM